MDLTSGLFGSQPDLKSLPNRTGCGRKHIIRIAADEPDCANYEDENNPKHHCVFGNVLRLFILPELSQMFIHTRVPSLVIPLAWSSKWLPSSERILLLVQAPVNVVRCAASRK